MWALRDSPDAEVEPTRRMVFLSVLYEQMIDRSVPSAEVDVIRRNNVDFNLTTAVLKVTVLYRRLIKYSRILYTVWHKYTFPRGTTLTDLAS